MKFRKKTIWEVELLKPLTLYNKKGINMDKIKKQLEESGYDYAVAIATQAEVEAGAACGQLAIINEYVED